jgi:glutamyl-tRNA reductase
MESRSTNSGAEHRERLRDAPFLPSAGVPRLAAADATHVIEESRHPASDPVIARFRAALLGIQNAELERLYHRLPELDEASRRAIQQFADALVAKMVDPALDSLGDESRSGSSRHLLDGLERLFRLRAAS